MRGAGRIAIGVALTALLAAATACGNRSPETFITSDTAVKEELVRGITQIRAAPGGKKLAPRLVRTVERLRHDRASTAAGRRGRGLAIQGFTWTLRGIRTQLDMEKNDSGNLEASVRDAKKADRYLKRGAKLLRAAGRAFGISIGKLVGH
jgi:hypothetical protein